ncbi:hypothetical protein QYF61_024346 [Mycteria americana]|uniref:Reverse transcriptase domain-containing protein n=1 Tax=Mycteria americana TaxID=33587 RepID=A0AAN7RRL8_MYCAM|nr:hypothetical protein QYF61_024346 [Mycteria americana]
MDLDLYAAYWLFQCKLVILLYALVAPDYTHSAPVWGPSHGRQSFMTFSNVGPSHRLQFFKNCSSMGPFHRVQSFRNGLRQRGSPTGHRSCQKTCSCVGTSPWATVPARSLLLHGLSPQAAASFRAHIHLLQRGVLHGLQGWISAPLWTSMGCKETTCVSVTMVFTTGCRGISASVIQRFSDSPKPAHPYNSPVWPVHKPNGTWCLTVDYHKLNENIGLLHVAVLSITDLVFTIEQVAHPWMVALDVKDMFFMVPLQPEDQERFAFTCGFKHSPTWSHQALARELEQVPQETEVIVYQYIDDILIGGDSPNKVQIMRDPILVHLENKGITIPEAK